MIIPASANVDAIQKEGLRGSMELDAKKRNALSDSQFAGPDRSYPIPDRSHGANALARVSQYGTPAEKAEVRRAVHKKYPDMGSDAGPRYKPGN